MANGVDWAAATFEGNRQRQHAEFLALSFREKLLRIEQGAEVAADFEARQLDRARVDRGEHGNVPPRDPKSSPDRNQD